MYKALRYLKVEGHYVDKGEVVKLGSLEEEEVLLLIERKAIAEATGTEGRPPSAEEEEEEVDIPNPEDDQGEEMTDEEVKAELMGKITHAIAVKELKLLGADFKANASLESLVELIMENEDYENHFFDYIEQNEL